MEGLQQNVYTCDVCLVELCPRRDTRIHCLECENYDACWDCHMSGRIPSMNVHQAWHQQETIPPNPFHPQNATISYASQPDPYWGCMVTQQKGASELFVRLANAIYTYIDFTSEPRQTSWLEPEKCSVVLDLLGYTPEENAFRSFHVESQRNGKGTAWSDEEVAFVYRQYGWDHTLASRESLRPVEERQYNEEFIQPVTQGMPLLSRKGFLTMMLGDALCDPGDFCARLNRLLLSIPPLVDPVTGQYFARMDVPRSSWPALADPEALWKGDQVQQERVRRATEQTAATRMIFVPSPGYPQNGNDPAFFYEKPQGGYWYYQQEFS